jgi:D-alanine transaminase
VAGIAPARALDKSSPSPRTVFAFPFAGILVTTHRESSMAKDLLWLNGTVTAIEDGRVPIEDRGLLFSDGIYEVVLFYDGVPFMIREHLDRWSFSAQGIMLDDPRDNHWRESMIRDLVAQSGHRNAAVYGQMTRGTARRNHLFPDPATTTPNEFWFVRAAPVHKAEHYENGVALLSHPDERWANCHYKTISLLPNCLAKERARLASCFEALLVREDGIVTECSTSNAYCLRDGVLCTHPRTPRILGGVTRIAILALARELGIPVREQPVHIDDFRAADEAFISSTTMEVMPATRLDGTPIGDGRVGEVTRRLRRALRERILGEVSVPSEGLAAARA